MFFFVFSFVWLVFKAHHLMMLAGEAVCINKVTNLLLPLTFVTCLCVFCSVGV